VNWLRIPGIVPGDINLIHEDGRLVEVDIPCELATDLPACCPEPLLVRNGSKVVRYRDRRLEPAPTWLSVRRQRGKCKACKATLYQPVPGVDDHHYITERLRDDLRLSTCNRSFRDAVAFHAVEESLARRVFRRYADEKLLDYRFNAPRVLGIDENHLFGKARGVVLDVESGRLLDMYEGCTGSHVRKGMMTHMDQWENVEVWCQDMAHAYKGVARDLFPKAQVVVDKFHVLMRAGVIWNKIRYRETPSLPPELRKKMPGIIRMFDKRWDTLKLSSQDTVAEILGQSPAMQAAYTIKESFQFFYEKQSRAEAEQTYRNWIDTVREYDQHSEWKPLMKMVQMNRDEIFAYFEHRFTSGKVERMNRSIADINREANGLDFVSLRAKALLRHGTLVPEEAYTFYSIDLSEPPPADPYPRPAGIISTRNAG
jgi:transposase